MAEYLAPGLFVEEIDSGSKPIEGVGTNTAAFIGFAKSGEFNTPKFISNWTQFVQEFGQEENALTKALCDELGATVYDVRQAKAASRKPWGEFAQIMIKRAVEQNKTDGVKSWNEFVKKHGIPTGGLPYMEDAYLAHAVRGYYDNGGGRCYVIRVATPDDMAALDYVSPTLKARAAAGVAKAADAAGAAAPQLAAGPLLLAARSAETAAAGDVSVRITPAGDAPADGDSPFTLTLTQGATTESFGTADAPLADPAAAAEAVNAGSKLVTATVADKPLPLAEAQTLTLPRFVLAAGAASDTALTAPAGTALAEPIDLSKLPSPLSNGLSNLRPADFVGDEAQRTGMGGLIALEDVNFIAVPDLMSGLWHRVDMLGSDDLGPEVLLMDDKRRQAILDMQTALVGHCERMGDRIAILDPIPGLTPLEMKTVTNDTNWACEHGQAAMYYPWIKVADPLHKGHQMFCPPSGHIAGVWARVGTQRGVHKAPANESIVGAVALEYAVTKGEQEILNPDGINCIRSFPGQGIRIWGARTLATQTNPSWKYINVRRLFNYIEGSLDRGLKWVVFEPNDATLWARVRRTIAAFLYTEWREGKLFGASPADAYYVKCDAETNPQETIDLGRLYCEIGVNPVKPAEFVIIRIGQWSSGSSVAE